jgi:hypothetical protein|tara:strand:- start:138 stop:713 length:576 start_codon:yes stop_codon:yes gene_type:complete
MTKRSHHFKNVSFLKTLKKTVEYGLCIDDIAKITREKDWVDARKIYCYLAYKLTKTTLSGIGEVVNRDHSTVLYLKRKCAEHLQQEPKFTDKFNLVELILPDPTKFHLEVNNNLALANQIQELKMMIIEKDLELNMKENIINAHNMEDKTELTLNEKQYRRLSKSKRAMFDFRASAILKMLQTTKTYKMYE